VQEAFVALYFFHLRDGGDMLLDPEGRQIADASVIPGMALTDARGIISQDALTGYVQLDQWIDVNDEAGALVHQLSFRDAVAFD
jgi:hypothetical protein